MSTTRRNGMPLFILIAVVMAVFLLPIGSVHAANAPEGVTATYADGNVTLSWNAVPNATQYNIYRGLSSGNESIYANVSGNVTSYVDTNVSVGNTYYYEVSAIVAGNETNLSSEVMISVTNSTGNTTTGGAGTTTTTTGDGSVTMGWLLFFGVLMLAAGIPLYFYGSKGHKDVAKYAIAGGVILAGISFFAERSGVQIAKITIGNVAVNSWMAVFGLAFAALGVVILLAASRKARANDFKDHVDLGRFSLLFGILLLFMSWAVGYIAGW